MKKTTQNSFQKRLAQYSALSLALVGLTDANGQVIYTDVVPDQTGPGQYAFDLNADADTDFFINQAGDSVTPYAVRGAPIGGTANSFQNAMMGITASSFNYPSNLTSGQVVSSASPWVSAYAYNDFCYGSGYPASNFCGGVVDGFVGLRIRFVAAGPFHYGWARLDITASPTATYTLKDFAYESTPGAPITIPDPATLGVEDNQFSNIKIIALNKSIALYNLNTNTSYKLFSMTGQVVMEGNINSDTHVIEANSAASGIYIIELVDNESNATIKKKIVL